MHYAARTLLERTATKADREGERNDWKNHVSRYSCLCHGSRRRRLCDQHFSVQRNRLTFTATNINQPGHRPGFFIPARPTNRGVTLSTWAFDLLAALLLAGSSDPVPIYRTAEASNCSSVPVPYAENCIATCKERFRRGSPTCGRYLRYSSVPGR